MASADDYAKWIVDNQKLQGTSEFNTVAQAYKEATAQESATAQPQKPGIPAYQSAIVGDGKGITEPAPKLINPLGDRLATPVTKAKSKLYCFKVSASMY
jgi:hypothetical protein